MDSTNINKPFLQFVNKIDNEFGCPNYSCNLCGVVFKGNYHRVVGHFIGKENDGITKCHCSQEQLNEMLRIFNQRQN